MEVQVKDALLSVLAARVKDVDGGRAQGCPHRFCYPLEQAEVDRLIALGATRIDMGQGEVSWVVMADPDGNEFCVWTPR